MKWLAVSTKVSGGESPPAHCSELIDLGEETATTQHSVGVAADFQRLTLELLTELGVL